MQEAQGIGGYIPPPFKLGGKVSPNLSKAGASLPCPLCLSFVALPISEGFCQLPHSGGSAGETRQAEPLDFSVMKSDCLDLIFSPALMCWIKIDALKTSPIVIGVFEGEATWLPLGHQGDWPFVLSSHSFMSCMRSRCQQLPFCCSRLSLERTSLP